MGRYRNAWTVTGALFAMIGCGPLLAVELLATIGLWPDPNPNPVGPGLLFFVSFWPALVCLAIGTSKGARQPRIVRSRSKTVTPSVEQATYLSSASVGGALGILYFAYMRVPGAFFSHIWDNISWPRMVANARRWAWEAGDWPDFETFRRRSQRADTAATAALAVTVPALLMLLLHGV